ncbi:MAG: hypothetical protein FWG36_02390 [Oscillospiraceae bacterium]|nr:hypothetical protein [Oscillospiraceae bacterium]
MDPKNNFANAPMNNPMANHPNPSMSQDESIERMYPYVHRMMRPYVENASYMLADDEDLTENKLNLMADDVLKNSGLADNPLPGHNLGTLSDLAKVMVMNNLYDDADELDYQQDPRFGFFPFSPFFFFPFDGRRFRRRRRGGRGRR